MRLFLHLLIPVSETSMDAFFWLFHPSFQHVFYYKGILKCVLIVLFLAQLESFHYIKHGNHSTSLKKIFFNCCSVLVVFIFPYPPPPPTLNPISLWLCPWVLYTCSLTWPFPFFPQLAPSFLLSGSPSFLKKHSFSSLLRHAKQKSFIILFT